MPTKATQAVLFDDAGDLSLFSSTPIKPALKPAKGPPANRQAAPLLFNVACRLCMDTGNTADGFCVCSAGMEASQSAPLRVDLSDRSVSPLFANFEQS